MIGSSGGTRTYNPRSTGGSSAVTGLCRHLSRCRITHPSPGPGIGPSLRAARRRPLRRLVARKGKKRARWVRLPRPRRADPAARRRHAVSSARRRSKTCDTGARSNMASACKPGTSSTTSFPPIEVREQFVRRNAVDSTCFCERFEPRHDASDAVHPAMDENAGGVGPFCEDLRNRVGGVHGMRHHGYRQASVIR
jgi:hypothetical protein